MSTLKCPHVPKSSSLLISPWICWKSMAIKWPWGVFRKPETQSGGGKLSPGRGRWQTIAIIMSNMSYLTLAFTRKYKELRGMHEVLNARERERETGKDLSLFHSVPPLLFQRWTERENILKSDALKSGRLTFAFQRGWLWRDEIGSWTARTGWQDGRGDGRGPLSPDIFPGS